MRQFLLFGWAMMLSCAATTAKGAIIDMEGIAPVGEAANAAGAPVQFGDFQLLAPVHGYYLDSIYISNQPGRPSNGTDWLQIGMQGLSLMRTDHGAFSLQSFEATEIHALWTGSQSITLTGNLAGGGTITQTFTTAPDSDDSAVNSFQLFSLSPSWTNLTSVMLISTDLIAIDNVAVQSAATTPEPATCVIWAGLGLLGLAASRPRKFALSPARDVTG